MLLLVGVLAHDRARELACFLEREGKARRKLRGTANGYVSGSESVLLNKRKGQGFFADLGDLLSQDRLTSGQSSLVPHPSTNGD